MSRQAAKSPAPRLLSRRVGAGLIDLAFVIGAAAALITVTATRLTISRRLDGSIAFTPEQQRQVNDMAGLLSRGHEFGDTLYVYSTQAVLGIAAAAAATALLVGVVVPLLTGGRSPGKLVFKLQVVSMDGRPPSAVGLLIRTVLGAADLMPVVVPGLTGFAFAASNRFHQRIGDRLARTRVVDSRRPSRTIDADLEKRLDALQKDDNKDERISVADEPDSQLDPADDATPESATLETVAEATSDPPPGRPPKPIPRSLRAPVAPATPLASAARASIRPGELNSRRETPDLKHSHVAAGSLSDELARSTAEVNPTKPANEHQRQRRHGETTTMSESANLQPDASADEDSLTEAERRPVEDRDANPYPKPVRRTTESSETKPSSYTALALPESSLSDMPLTNSALYEALGLSEEDAARIIGQESEAVERTEPEPTESVGPIEPVEPEPEAIEPIESFESIESIEQTDPEPVERVEPPHPFDVAPVSQTESTDDHQADAAAPSQAAPIQALTKDQWKEPPQQSQITTSAAVEHPATGTDTQVRTEAAVATTATTNEDASAADNRAPIWSEDWDAWIYWDTTVHGWFRHDESLGEWVPMDE